MESGAVKESVPSVLHSCRMSTKNASKTQPFTVFQQSNSIGNNPYLLPQSLQGLAETLGLNPEQTQHVLQRLSRHVGIVPLFRANTLRYGLAE